MAMEGRSLGLLIAARSPDAGAVASGTAVPTLEMQCHRFALSDFDGPEVKEKQPIRHAGELQAREETTFCVDVAQMGVGGIDSWGSKPLPEHTIAKGQSFSWSFSLRPLTVKEVGSDP